jgi:lipopolysaccharide biosynthesis protein
MKSICLFCSYYDSGEIPYYIRHYLEELRRHCDKVIFITNEKKMSPDSLLFLKEQDIEFLPVKNEGYDFGMWAKALEIYSPENYGRLILVNDSCVLLGKLDDTLALIADKQWDYAGLLSSGEQGYHVQSYFLVLCPPAYKPFQSYLQKHGLQKEIRNVIDTYEVGLTAYMLEKKLSVGSVFDFKQFPRAYNPVYSSIGELLHQGFPVIKKKLLFDTFSLRERVSLMRNGVKTGSSRYFDLVAENTTPGPGSVDPEMLKKDKQGYANEFQVFRHSLYIFAYQLLRKLAGRSRAGKSSQ